MFKSILAQCLGYLEITWDECDEYVGRVAYTVENRQVGSVLRFSLGAAIL